MEQIPVENMNPEISEIQQDDAAETEPIALEDLVKDYEQGIADTQNAAAAAPAPSEPRHSDAQPAPRDKSQVDFDKVLGKRLYDERAKLTRTYESSPEYQLGRALIQERAARDGITPEEAARRVQADRRKTMAAEYAKNPEQYYYDQLAQREQQTNQNPQPEQQRLPQRDAVSLTQQLIDLGAPSLGFLPQHITPQFAEDAQAYGVSAALALWQRTQSQAVNAQAVASELEQRKRMPQPIRPVGQGAAAPTTDYARMSKEEFAKRKAALKQAALEGRRVRL